MKLKTAAGLATKSTKNAKTGEGEAGGFAFLSANFVRFVFKSDSKP